MLDVNSDLKRCSKGLDCCHPDNIDGWLDRVEFSKSPDSKDKFYYICKVCQSKRQKFLQQNSLWYIVRKRTNSANFEELNRSKKQKFTPMGSGKHKSLYNVLSKRTNNSNQTTKTRKRKNELIKTVESIALLISQNYICPITNESLADNYSHLSLDHIVPDETGGLNLIENTIFVYDIFNYAKNGYTLTDTLEILLKIGGLNDQQRKQKIDEITERIWKIHDIYPKIYEIIKDYNRKKLTEILEKRLTINDILNTT